MWIPVILNTQSRDTSSVTSLHVDDANLWSMKGLCPSLTVPTVLPNVDECKKFEIRANSSWGKDESEIFHLGSVLSR